MCAVDISKAFNAIDHTLLMKQICESSLHPNLVRWLAAYLRGRKAWCQYNSATSKSRILCFGVLQGLVLSPVIFNFFVSDCPYLAVILTSYADDFTLLDSDADLEALDRKLQASVTSVIEWAKSKKLSIAPTKSQVTLLTPFNKQYNVHPAVTIDGVDIPLNRVPKILGVTFDTMFCFRNHVADIYAKACQRLNILRVVAGSDWGHDKETLLIRYRALVESVLNFACPIWFPNCKPNNVQKLQLVQNAPLRLITDCHKAASVNHLHAEVKLMPVAEHLSLLCMQFLASRMHPSHPSHE
jgi:hypothetical protein